MSSEQKTDHPKTISAVKNNDEAEAHKKLNANTARHVVNNKVVTVTFTVFQDRIFGIGKEQIMTFLENRAFFQNVCSDFL